MAEDFYNYMGGCGLGTYPCHNCESEPQRNEWGMFCSGECADEFNGEGEYA